MTEQPGGFRLKPLNKRPESLEEINRQIAKILAEGFRSYLLRHGLLKQRGTTAILARIDELKKSRPNYDAL